MEQITREQAIEMLVGDDCDTIRQQIEENPFGLSSIVVSMLKDGNEGWKDVATDELEWDINHRFNGEYKIEG